MDFPHITQAARIIKWNTYLLFRNIINLIVSHERNAQFCSTATSVDNGVSLGIPQ
jgi:hypothetical protein